MGVGPLSGWRGREKSIQKRGSNYKLLGPLCSTPLRFWTFRVDGAEDNWYQGLTHNVSLFLSWKLEPCFSDSKVRIRETGAEEIVQLVEHLP